MADNEFSLKGQVALVTGSGRGLGHAIASRLAELGADVAIHDREVNSPAEFGEFTDTVDLAPGTYEIRAFESSMEDGSPQHVDTKTFTVE